MRPHTGWHSYSLVICLLLLFNSFVCLFYSAIFYAHTKMFFICERYWNKYDVVIFNGIEASFNPTHNKCIW